MDLKQLECFVRVAELGSYTRASIVMAVSQPTLSRNVRQLEIELARTLFSRNGRGISLTDNGVFFLPYAKAILSQHVQALEGLRQLADNPVGTVIIGAPPFVGRILTLRLVSAFRERFPKASIEIVEGRSWSIHEWLLMGRIDIGVWYNPIPSVHIEISPLVAKEQFLISRADAPEPSGRTVAFQDLGGFPLILPSHPNTQRILLETLVAEAGVKLNVPLQISGSSLILELVHQGHGHTILPRYIVEESPLAEKLRATPIVNPTPAIMLSLVVSAQRPMTRLARATSSLIQSFLGPGSAFAER
jgi:LysR family nitrogen assimilation transcriptional regulator